MRKSFSLERFHCQRVIFLVAGATVAIASLGCAKKQSSDGAAPSNGKADAAISHTAPGRDLHTPYEHGKWRMLQPEQLQQVVLWTSHILIRHEKSNGDLFRYPGWEPDGPNPSRTHDQARKIADDLAARAASAPDTFAKLAREFSEDALTRERGGRLGGMRAGLLPPAFLDALAALAPGETSKPFQTRWGFHVIRREPPPAPGVVSGERILIRYAGAYPGFGQPPSTRKRTEALALAEQLVQRVRQNPDDFSGLVKKYSEHPDRAQGGDLGEWSVREPGREIVTLETLSSLRIGEVSSPVDSRLGFQVIRRVPLRDRTQYAMAAIRLKFDPTAPAEHEFSTASVRRKAQQLAPEAQNADRFRELQKRYPSDDEFEQWSAGRGSIAVQAAIEKLAIGEVTKQPVKDLLHYVVFKRLEPKKPAPLPEWLYELPAPKAPDFAAILRNGDGSVLARYAEALGKEGPRRLGLTELQARKFTQVMVDVAGILRATKDPDERVSKVRSVTATLPSILGQAKHEEYKRFLADWTTSKFLK